MTRNGRISRDIVRFTASDLIQEHYSNSTDTIFSHFYHDSLSLELQIHITYRYIYGRYTLNVHYRAKGL